METNMFDTKLLEILVCPECKAELKYNADELICHKCKLAYKIEDGIPIMLVNEAREIGDVE
jgi:uncharacterized protein YbaR (Trm112 family)